MVGAAEAAPVEQGRGGQRPYVSSQMAASGLSAGQWPYSLPRAQTSARPRRSRRTASAASETSAADVRGEVALLSEVDRGFRPSSGAVRCGAGTVGVARGEGDAGGFVGRDGAIISKASRAGAWTTCRVRASGRGSGNRATPAGGPGTGGR
ncbi:hypothetical protein [Streptomyces sp. P9-A2]|uniref:hypothetical protein n=1 Tax=Streptomyces sp. P9-A2 TaxID=3072284 RepID=UPI002FC7BC3D